ncbi:MAG: type phosphodiesterase / nucleotide pyrophosphatase [Anaerocolumna sp.]|nr:type phosphodiesterase / nucleotide pyrophosphatase [Anaerocolumna sp.]
MHPKFEEFIGDYLAVAISDKGIVYSQESKQFISNHAGLTEQEMKIPIIAICKK